LIEFGSIDAIAAAQVFGASAGTKATARPFPNSMALRLAVL